MKNVIILLIIFFLVRALRKGFMARQARKLRTAGQQQADHQRRERSSRSESEEMVKDEVCGSYVPVSAAIVAEAGGRRAYFCSEECRDKYSAPS
ncbi:MAG TPA: transcriptional regulator [Thermodesulfobacteriota bacterium]